MNHRILAAALLCIAGGVAHAQNYPNKTVRIIVPFAPGGGPDFIARQIAPPHTKATGQQFVVDNRPGAGSTLGSEIALKSPADGYTLLLISGSYTTSPSLYKNLKYDPLNDMASVIQTENGPYVVTVHPSLPAKTVKDLVAIAKSKPGQLNYASTGNGGITHLSAELFALYFVTGHGEASLASTGGGAQSDRSLAVLAEALKRENIEAADTVLLSGEVPSDADVLAIVGPTRPFTEPELAALEAFIGRGGRLLVCLDPLIEPAGTMRATRLEGLLATRGIRVNDDLVVDPSRKLPFYDLSAVYLTDFPSHPVTQGLEGIAVLFSVARSLTAEGAAAPVVIVETSAEGWGERNLGQLLTGQPVARDGDDTPGPAAVGVVVEEGPVSGSSPGDGKAPAAEPGFRIVVYGDSDFMADYEISNAGNLILAMNTINWLAAREQSLGIPPREVEQVSLFLSQQQLRTILLITMLAMPGAAIVLGILVWRKRRH